MQPARRSARQLRVERLEDRAVPASFRTLNGEPHAVSADGWTVVGGRYAGDAFRWTQATGMVGLGGSSGGLSSIAGYDVSADGSVVVGLAESPPHQQQAFRWTKANGVVGLGFFPSPNPFSFAQAVSADGSVVVGGSSILPTHLFRWTGETGLVDLGADVNLYLANKVLHISADGSVVVGYASFERGYEPFRWTEATGTVRLGSDFFPAGVSADGSVIDGGRVRNDGTEWVTEWVRWTEATGPVVMGHDFSPAAVSADGSVVVGTGRVVAGAEFEPAVWQASTGVRLLRDLCQENGLGNPLAGWRWLDVMDVSGDGKVIIGDGLDPARGESAQPVGWVIDLRKPAKVTDFREASQAESGSPTPDALLLEYDLEDPVWSLKFRFVASADPAADSRDRPLAELTLRPDDITKSQGAYELVGEPASEATRPGKHKLLIRPGAPVRSALAGALANAAVNYVLAVSGDGPDPSEAPFRGIYQPSAGGPLVVRGGDNDDVVTIAPDDAGVSVSLAGRGAGAREATVPAPSRVLVLGAGGNDDVKASGLVKAPVELNGGPGADSLTGGGWDDVLVGGRGGDTYRFAPWYMRTAQVRETAAESDPGDEDTLDFRDFGAAIAVDLGRTGSQTVWRVQPAAGPRLRLEDARGIENAVATAFDDWIMGNDRDNDLKGGDGNDVLYGRGGDDTLSGEAGADALFGGPGTDALTGGPGADRFLNQNGADEAQDAAAEDARFQFVDGQTKDLAWTEAQVRAVDGALALLERKTNNTRLLKDSTGGPAGGLSFIRVASLTGPPDAWGRAETDINGQPTGRVLLSTAGVSRSAADVGRTVAHELAHFWAGYVGPGGQSLLDRFVTLSDWRIWYDKSPLPPGGFGPNGYTKAGRYVDATGKVY